MIRNGRRCSRKYFHAFLVVFALAGLAATGCNDNSGSTATPSACTPVGANGKAASSPIEASFLGGKHLAPRLSQYSDQGKVEDSQLLPVSIALSLNNEDDLDQRLAAMYTPGSPTFHQFMSHAEFKVRYSPTFTQSQKAQQFLASHGLQVSGTSEDGLLIHAMGDAAAISDAFQTEIHQFKDTKGNSYFAPANEPVFPGDLSIRAVHGLDNLAQYKSHTQVFAKNANAAAVAHYGAGPLGGLSPADVRAAYKIPSSVNGSGQTLALVELDGYNASDIQAYEREFGLPNVPLQNVLIDGASGVAGSGSSEVTLDIELMTAVATGASKIYVYEAPNSAQGLLDLYSRIATDQVPVVSISWGGPEAEQSTAFLETETQLFKQMAVQGQSVFAAAGDSGADDNGSSLSVDDPGSQPFVVSVGGTHLNYSGAYVSESTWDNGSPAAGAGGGGVSSVWTQPSWQAGVANSQNEASSTMRNVPDVSLNSDPSTGYSIYLSGTWQIYGGTSCAAPLWAAFTALVNQQRAVNGLGHLGFPNPYLYSIGASSSYSSDFHDIEDHSTNLYYPAVPGYDDATGWGSFNGQGLFQDLSTEPAVSQSALSC